jgi:hypothetical protein
MVQLISISKILCMPMSNIFSRFSCRPFLHRYCLIFARFWSKFIFTQTQVTRLSEHTLYLNFFVKIIMLFFTKKRILMTVKMYLNMHLFDSIQHFSLLPADRHHNEWNSNWFPCLYSCGRTYSLQSHKCGR